MKTYTVNATITISLYTIVEADTEAEALEIAEGRSLPTISTPEQFHRGDKIAREGWMHTGELDGTPDNLKAEEA